MASKQLGKLRQWAGEVISSRDKPTISEEFQELEKDIELRKEGANRLHIAAEGYHHSLSKKSSCEALEGADQLLPVDALGIVMIAHGEEFPHDSDFGASLVKFGRAHCKAATLQEAYALTFKDTFITAIEHLRDEIKEYEALRKKLETRRTTLDSANARYEKARGSKKDKDRIEAEEELDRQQQRYDETEEDMRAHMHGIQEKEISQQRELTRFLDLEINFVEQYLDVLKEVRDDWPDKLPVQSRPKSHRSSVSRTRPAISAPSPILPSQQLSHSPDESSEDELEDAKPSRFTMRHRKSPSTGSRASSRPPSRSGSRPSSRLSRRRTNSSAKSRSIDLNRDTQIENKEKDSEDRPRRFSVAGWASNAVDSITARGNKSKDKDSFASLDDDTGTSTAQEIDAGPEASPTALKKSNSFSLSGKLSLRRKSKESIPTLASPATPRILKPPSLQGSKFVYALGDFKGSSEDELSFKSGTGIKVLNEVVDGWWMGEIDGRKGLFPTTHVSSSPPKASLPSRPPKNGKYIGLLSPPPPTATFPPDAHGDHQEGYATSDLEEEFGYHQPMAHNRSPVYGRFSDAASVISQEEESSPKIPPFIPRPRRFSDDFETVNDQPMKTKLERILGTTTPRAKALELDTDLEGHIKDTATQPLIGRSSSEGNPGQIRPGGSPTKRVPPPPPPRRAATTVGVAAPRPIPAIPERKPGSAAASRPVPAPQQQRSYASSNESVGSIRNSGLGLGLDYDVSPFESAAELSMGNGNGNVCGKFRQNPFQPQGMCANCKHYHS